jgi:glutamine amidotransferase
MKLAIIESGGANFLSVTTAIERLGVKYQFTHDAQIINSADAVLLPGVGSAGFAMQTLHKYDLVDVVKNFQKPLLGICLGMQLLYEFSEEDNVDCLGVIPGQVKKFSSSNDLIVPHMGWNNISPINLDKIVSGVDTSDDVYFVHSYYAPINDATIASCDYGTEFTAVVRYNNFYGMQFHPEKSGIVGAKLLKNFLEIVNDNLSSH